jgi:hypothetical protein
MIAKIYTIALIALMGCSGVDTPTEPEPQADYTADALLRFINRDANASAELIGQTLTLQGAVWQVHLDVSPPFFTLRSGADIQIYLLDESLEIHRKLLTRQTDVIVEGIIESIEPPNTIIFTSAILLN